MKIKTKFKLNESIKKIIYKSTYFYFNMIYLLISHNFIKVLTRLGYMLKFKIEAFLLFRKVR